jgi:hypothetical protein
LNEGSFIKLTPQGLNGPTEEGTFEQQIRYHRVCPRVDTIVDLHYSGTYIWYIPGPGEGAGINMRFTEGPYYQSNVYGDTVQVGISPRGEMTPGVPQRDIDTYWFFNFLPD